MQRAATAFVTEAPRRTTTGTALDVDLADAFKGFVLAAAVEEEGRDEVFRLFGKESLMKNRNHTKVLRREIEKVEALHREVSATPREFFTPLLNDPGEDSEDG